MPRGRLKSHRGVEQGLRILLLVLPSIGSGGDTSHGWLVTVGKPRKVILWGLFLNQGHPHLQLPLLWLVAVACITQHLVHRFQAPRGLSRPWLRPWQDQDLLGLGG